MLVQLGLTDFGVDQIGNIQALKLKAKLGEPLAKGEPICDLDWEGFIITDGDELYHTRWDNREGKHTIHAPFSILEVQEVNEKALKDPDTAVVDGEWLLRMRIKNDDFATLLNEDEYAKHCDSLAPEGW
jgi:glycine cleavage system H lipoate-binding protein